MSSSTGNGSRDSLFNTARPWSGASERPLAQTPAKPSAIPAEGFAATTFFFFFFGVFRRGIGRRCLRRSTSPTSSRDLPLEDDLAISSSDEEGAPPVSGRCSLVAAVSPHPAEPSFPDLLDHPLPPAVGDLSMPSLDALAAAPSFAPASAPPPSAASSEDPPVPSLDNVTTQSILFRPLGSQVMIFKEEEGGKSQGVSSWTVSTSAPSALSTTGCAPLGSPPSPSSGTWPTSCIGALSPPSLRSLKNSCLSNTAFCLSKHSTQQGLEGTSWRSPRTRRPRSSEDFHAKPLVQKAAEKVLNSFKGDFSRLPPSPKSKEKPRVAFQATGKLVDYLNAPLLDISRMHKEDNIQAIVSTPRPSLVLEEKEARDQLKRAVDFHKSFIQTAKFLSTLQEGSYPQDQGSLSMTLKNYASYFSLCGAAFEKEVSYFAEKAARKKMVVKLAAMSNFVNPTLRTPFMTADLLSPNLVSAPMEARATVKAVKDLPDRALEKAFKDPNLPMEAVRRKPTKPSLVKIPQKPTPHAALGYQHKPQPPPQPHHSKATPAHFKKGAPSSSGFHQSSLQSQPPFPRRDHQEGGKARDKSTQGRKHDRDLHQRRRHWGCSGRQAPNVSGSLGRRPSFHSNHHQKRLPLGMDLRAPDSGNSKAEGWGSRPRRRSLQARGNKRGLSTRSLYSPASRQTSSAYPKLQEDLAPS